MCPAALLLAIKQKNNGLDSPRDKGFNYFPLWEVLIPCVNICILCNISESKRHNSLCIKELDIS
jgi:hypothetical protein